MGGFNLKVATSVVGTGVAVAVGETKTATVTLPRGHETARRRFRVGTNNTSGTAVISSSPTFVGDPNVTWEVQGRIDTGGTANTIFAEALCINA